MKLFYNLLIFLIILFILVLGGAGYINYQREVMHFNKDMENDAFLLGRALSGLVEFAWKTSGPDAALKLIEETNIKEHQVKIRWVWLDSSATAQYAPKVPLEKLGKAIHGKNMSLVATIHEEDFRFTYIPLNMNTNRPGAIELSESLSLLKRFTQNSILHILYTTGILILAVAVVLWFRFQIWIRQPLTQFIDKSIKIGHGDLTPDLVVKSNDEFGQLARTLNSMCEKIEATNQAIRIEHQHKIAALEQLRHTERLATLGRISAGMAHELGTPLNVISGRSKMIKSGELEADEIMECSRIISDQTERITGIMRNLLDFARRRPLDQSPQDMEQLVKQVLEMLKSTASKAGVIFEIIKQDPLPRIAVDSTQMQQVLTNLILNGIQAMPDGGRLVVMLGLESRRRTENDTTNQTFMYIQIKDEGQGITKEHIRHLFEPFFTTKEVGSGTGLGLSIAYGIVEEHNGWIHVESEPGQGACFSIFLPLEGRP